MMTSINWPRPRVTGRIAHRDAKAIRLPLPAVGLLPAGPAGLDRTDLLLLACAAGGVAIVLAAGCVWAFDLLRLVRELHRPSQPARIFHRHRQNYCVLRGHRGIFAFLF